MASPGFGALLVALAGGVFAAICSDVGTAFCALALPLADPPSADAVMLFIFGAGLAATAGFDTAVLPLAGATSTCSVTFGAALALSLPDTGLVDGVGSATRAGAVPTPARRDSPCSARSNR